MIMVLNTGGTFNKIYNEVTGKLVIQNNNFLIKQIIDTHFKTNKKPIIKGLIYKDSLELTKKDRELLLKEIKKYKSKKIIIVHGTDTMNITAKFLDKRIKNKTIILVGAMQPFSINPIEATASLMMAFGYLQNIKNKNGIFISMNGLIKKHNKVKKNKQLGVFECR